MRFEHTHKFSYLSMISYCLNFPMATKPLRGVMPRSVWSTGQDQCASIKRMLAAMLPGVSVFLDVHQRPMRPYRPLLCDRLPSLRPHIATHGTYSGVPCSLCYSTRLLANPVVMNAFLCFQPQNRLIICGPSMLSKRKSPRLVSS